MTNRESQQHIKKQNQQVTKQAHNHTSNRKGRNESIRSTVDWMNVQYVFL